MSWLLAINENILMHQVVNAIVNNAIEIIFGIFIVSFLADAMLGIDIVGGMKKIFNKIVGDKGEDKDEE